VTSSRSSRLDHSKCQEGRRTQVCAQSWRLHSLRTRSFILMPASKEDIPYDILLTGVVVSFKSVVEKSAAHAITRVLGDMAKGDGRRTTRPRAGAGGRPRPRAGVSGDEPNMFKSISENIDSQYQKVNAVITLDCKESGRG